MSETPMDDERTQRRVLLGRRIREARLAQVITQRELAERSGLGRDAIAKYETGARSISAEDLGLLAEALETTSSALLGERAYAAPATEQPLPAEIQTVTRILQQHPNLTPHILETIELLLERQINEETQHPRS